MLATLEENQHFRKNIPSVKHGGGRKMVWDASGLWQPVVINKIKQYEFNSESQYPSVFNLNSISWFMQQICL